MELVILESPYAGDVKKNIAYARMCLRDSLYRGEAPIASHLLYTQEGVLDDNIPEERQMGIDAGLSWKEVAHKHVFYIDYGYSKGMLYAKEKAILSGAIIEERRILKTTKQNIFIRGEEDLYKSHIIKLLEIKYFNHLMDATTIKKISNDLKRYIKKNLQNYNFSDFSKIDFEIKAEIDDLLLNISPKNFFTALLIRDIFFEEALYGADVFENEEGVYSWNEKSGLTFLPNKKIKIIDVKLDF